MPVEVIKANGVDNAILNHHLNRMIPALKGRCQSQDMVKNSKRDDNLEPFRK